MISAWTWLYRSLGNCVQILPLLGVRFLAQPVFSNCSYQQALKGTQHNEWSNFGTFFLLSVNESRSHKYVFLTKSHNISCGSYIWVTLKATSCPEKWLALFESRRVLSSSAGIFVSVYHATRTWKRRYLKKKWDPETKCRDH